MEYVNNNKTPAESEEIREREERKLEASEGVRRERDSKRDRRKKPEGYEQHPAEEKTYEVFGLKNSFDNLSVSSDDRGRMTLAVSSQKSFHGATLDATKKKLRGSRRRTKYEHWGEFYTDPAARGMGAFAFRTRKNLPEHRILREFKGTANKYVDPARLEALPFLTLEEDRERLAELRSREGSSSADISERLALEQTIVRKTELENRFIRKLRIARRQTYAKPVTEYTEPEQVVRAVTDGADGADGDETGEENIQEK
jgi:hypothetical protein